MSTTKQKLWKWFPVSEQGVLIGNPIELTPTESNQLSGQGVEVDKETCAAFKNDGWYTRILYNPFMKTARYFVMALPSPLLDVKFYDKTGGWNIESIPPLDVRDTV
jgi:hypothetical protein